MEMMMRIGELSNQAGVSGKTIRYYESIGLLPEPARSPNGYRTYTEHHLEQIKFVIGARALGIRIEDIKPLAQSFEQGRASCEHVLQTLEIRIVECTEKISQLKALKHELESLKKEGLRLTEDKGEKCICSLIEQVGDR
jgi:DNA-binding transcriptional MerR regulator